MRASTRRVVDEPTRSSSPVSSARKKLGLKIHRHVRNFVEEERAAVGELEAADAIRFCVGECALHVAEKLAFENAFGQAAGVDGDERPSDARRKSVERARDHFFAGAVLARDQDVRVGRAHARN